MRRNIKIISLLLIVLSVIGIFIYKSPDESYWLKENPQDAIGIGRTYSHYLLNGNKRGLFEMSIDPAKAKIENSNFQEIWMSYIHNELEKKQLDLEVLFENKQWGEYEIVAPLLFLEIKDIELVMLERLDSFIVMTFAYKYLDKIVEIPDKGKMLFSVAVRYYKPIDKRLIYKVVRKIANLPLIRNFTGRLGTTGRWVVFDYNYKYNLNDYLEWVLKEGKDYGKKISKEREEFAHQLEDKKGWKKFEAASDRGLDFNYDWGSVGVDKQIGRIERLYKAQQEVEKNSLGTE